MAMVTARRLCPDAVFVQPDFQRYKAASDAVFAIYRDVTALVEPVSMDEAFQRTLKGRSSGLESRRRRAKAGPSIILGFF